MRRRLPADLLLLLTVLIWSFNFTAVKYALAAGFAPLAFAAVRFAGAAALFAAFTVAREGTVRVARRDLVLVAVAAALGIWANQVAFVYALRLTTAATVALVLGTLPVFTALAARALGLERLQVRHWVATAVAFGGAALVALGAEEGLAGDLGGVLLAIAVSATWAAYSVAVVPLMRRYSPYRASAAILLVGVAPLVASAAGQLAAQDWTRPGALAWAALLYGLLFALVLTNVLWFEAIGRVGASRATLYTNLQPFLGAVFALLVLGEELSRWEIAGGLVIGAAIVLAARREPAAARQ